MTHVILAKGHGTRQSCRTNKYGFPIRHCSRHKIHKGFQTGDIVKAIVTKGKKIGTYVGRVATRATGSFNISTKCGLVQGISYKYCKPVQRKDGYAYHFQGYTPLRGRQKACMQKAKVELILLPFDF